MLCESPSFTFNVTIMKESYARNVGYHLMSFHIPGSEIRWLLLSVPTAEKIYWCWTSSLKLWITRKLSRRRPMKLQGFSVRFSLFHGHCDSVGPWRTFHIVFMRDALRVRLWTHETDWTHFHNLMFLQGQQGCVWWEVWPAWTLLTIQLR